MANSRPDYVYVQLTPEGVAFAGGVPLRVSGSKRSFVFEGDTPQEVVRSAEWRGILANHTTADGTRLFQLVSPAEADTITAAPAAKPADPAPAKPAPAKAAAEAATTVTAQSKS